LKYRKFPMIIISFILLLSITTTISAQNVVSGKIEPEQIEIGKQGKIEIIFNIPEGMHQSLQEDYFYIEAEEVEGIEFLTVQYPEGKEHEGIIDYYDSVTLTMELIVADDATVGEYTIKIYAGYQFCDDAGMCHFPEEEELALSLVISGKTSASSTQKIISADRKSENVTTTEIGFAEIKSKLDEFVMTDIAAGYLKSKDFITFAENAKTADGSSANKFAGMSIWLILLLIVVGGIALNLTPCVLPMMPITIAVLGAGTQAESKGKGFLIGGLYGIGMMLAYGALGLIVVLTGSRFGAINSSPVFNIIIAIIFIFACPCHV